MEITNVSQFHSELVAAGLSISGCDSSGNVHILSRPTAPLIGGEPDPNWTDPTDSIIALALAAHGQPLTSDECLALQAALTEAQWLAYQDARKAPIRAQRAERYKTTTDPLFMAAMEESTTLFDAVEQVYNVKVDKTKWDLWLESKNAIRVELAYPT